MTSAAGPLGKGFVLHGAGLIIDLSLVTTDAQLIRLGPQQRGHVAKVRFVAGIALKNSDLLRGILLSNPICQFSTFIGKKKTPGIAKGIDAQSIEVNFIPKWSKIEVGDKVVTSGLDNIFLPEIPVGIVTNILTKSTYKTAIVETYADVLHPNFFYLVKEVLNEPKELNISKIKLENNSSKEKE